MCGRECQETDLGSGVLVLKSISAPPQRSLRLCGGFAQYKKVHRGVAENAEGAQRVEIGTPPFGTDFAE